MKNFIKFVIVIFVIIAIIYLGYTFIFTNKRASQTAESAQNSPFSISKITVYTSAHGINKNANFQQNNWVLDIWQYSDIAVFIDNGESTLSPENTVKALSLTDISISAPKLGTSNLYYLDTLTFGTPTISENYKLADYLEFTALNDSNENSWAKYNTPIFFTDCSNPITLKYVNNPVKENFEIQANEPVFFDGRLLKMAEIPLDDLAATIHFTVNLKSNDDKKFECKIALPISLENETSSIYDGSVLIENEYEDLSFEKVAE